MDGEGIPQAVAEDEGTGEPVRQCLSFFLEKKKEAKKNLLEEFNICIGLL